ncbi:MAG TPA: HemK/PrmC family methyltransferase [Candidatus Limnocylindria bacterium]|nr:HemK/PrmC family methyltransferase [Candidatus Limnocylindria bacterium]
MTAQRTTVAAVIADVTRRLREVEPDTSRLDAELLLGHLMGRERAWLLGHGDDPVAPELLVDLAGLVERRAAGEPIAYLRGFKEWFGLRVRTDRRALIPRPETELLAESAIAEIAGRLAADPGGHPIHAWEVATGSGAVSLALALRFRVALRLERVRLAASDLSSEALELAAENLAAHRVGGLVTLACTDLLDGAGELLPTPDVVIANLPYVASAEVATARGSLVHEPRAALDGGSDGLDLVRRLLAAAPAAVAPRGTLLLEVGAGQDAVVRDHAPPGASVTVLPDLAGVGRVVRLDLP